MDIYIKENNNLSQEWVIALIITACSDPIVIFLPEFLFKGKRTRTTLHSPTGVKYNWVLKGLNCLKQMLYK